MADIYVKFGDSIKGESTDDKHAEWCEIDSFGVGVAQPISQASGSGGRTASGVQFHDFSMSKGMDLASPDIFKFCCTGEHIDKVEVECVLSAGEERHVYLIYTLEDVVISSYSTSGNEGAKPIESLTLNVGKFKEEYKAIDHKGKVANSLARGWNLETNKPAD
jgi:type VI secretion system Hcp family effector